MRRALTGQPQFDFPYKNHIIHLDALDGQPLWKKATFLNRRDLKNLALTRLKEVEVLLKNRQYSGAYYLSGYIIECALKACIAKQTQKFDFPEKKTVMDSYTHDLEKLVKVAKLDSQLKSLLNDPNFSPRWLEVKDWSEESRYRKYSRQKAQDIYSAITDPHHGVLQWLQQHW